MGKSITVTFNGITYRRYPNAKSWSDRNYFRASPSDRKKGASRLHVDLWKSVYGDVPEGCHIHHKDNNPLNNSIDNLECLAPEDHVDAHRGNPERRTPEWLEKLDQARKFSVQWARSEEGRRVAGDRQRRVMAKLVATEHKCEQCGKLFLSRHRGKLRFCSSACDSAWRLAQRSYYEERVCAFCGKTFSVDKWKKQSCCSRSCGQSYKRACQNAGI